MAVLISFFAAILEFFKMPLNVYGFTFSFWDIILYTALAGILLRFIVGVFFYD